MKVRIKIDKVAALKAGHDRHGYVVVDIPAGELTDRQREALSDFDYSAQAEPGADFFLDGVYNKRDYRNVADKLVMTEATAEAIKGILDVVADERDAIAKRQAEERAEAEAKFKADLEDFLTGDPDRYIHQNSYVYPIESAGGVYVWDYIYGTKSFREVDDPRVAHRFAEIDALIEGRNAVILREHKEEVEARRAKAAREAQEAEARERAQAEQIAAWVIKHGTPSQQGRHAEGLLPKEEVLAVFREEAFAPLKAWPRYERMTPADVACTCEYGEDCQVEWETDDLDELSAGQYRKLCAARSLMPGAEITPRWHSGTRSECGCSLGRPSLLVKVGVGAFSFSREYHLVEDDGHAQAES